MIVGVEAVSSVRFGALARQLASESRRHGLTTPWFRSPPRLPGALRTIRRYRAGGSVVAIRLRGRTEAEVVADMVDGVLAANGISGVAADGWRIALAAALLGPQALAPPAPPAAPAAAPATAA